MIAAPRFPLSAARLTTFPDLRPVFLGGRGGEIYEESSATFPPISSSANYFSRLAPCVPKVVKLPVCPDDLLHGGGRHMVSSLYTERYSGCRVPCFGKI